MIANLLIMVIVGGYETFVSRLNLKGHPDQPEWLSHVNAGILKVKLATALIGIFVDSSAQNIHQREHRRNGSGLSQGVMWQVIIHVTFVASAGAGVALDRPPDLPGRSLSRMRRGRCQGWFGCLSRVDELQCSGSSDHCPRQPKSDWRVNRGASCCLPGRLETARTTFCSVDSP